MAGSKSKPQKRDAVLRTMLRTPPEPHEQKPKAHKSSERQLKELGDLIGRKEPNWTDDGQFKREK